MPRSMLFSLVLLIAGVVLLVWGFQARESFASDVSEAVQGAPTDKSMVLLVIGGLVAAAGLIGMLRGKK